MSFANAFANMNKSKKEIFDNNKSSQQPTPSVKKEKEQKEFKPKANIGWLFYKDYFKDLNYSKLDDSKNEDIINKKVNNIINQKFTMQKSKDLGNTKFELSIIYPGLLIGSGNTHELPDIKGQAILGFHFDYTSGLPEITGSSIKGILRSAFNNEKYIKEILDKDDTLNIKKLESEIFDNNDIFFDAIIIKSGKNNKILEDDFITPHKEATKNPIPLRFIKVLPEVTFEFQFLLQDGIIKKEQKLNLFKQIILDFGLGDKNKCRIWKIPRIKDNIDVYINFITYFYTSKLPICI